MGDFISPYAGRMRPVRPERPTTKWDLMTPEQRAGLDGQDSGVTGGCSGCGADVSTEGRFARHFVLPDLRYWNLGDCPDKELNR